MKSTLRRPTEIVAVLSLLIAHAACSGGGGKSGPKVLETGTYAWRGVEGDDACQFLDDYGLVEGVEVPVFVTSTAVTIDSTVLVRDSSDATRFGTAFSQTIDWRPAGYDCIERDDHAIEGSVVGENVADVDVTITFTAVTGTGCNLANAPVTLPCTTTGSARLERL